MNVFIYRADIYCEGCGNAIRRDLDSQGFPYRPDDPADESSYDSDSYPKGPYANGGGEADTPQHCGACGVFLENPLTTEGVAYVKECAADLGDSESSWSDLADDAKKANRPHLAEWISFYFQGWRLD